VFSREVIIFDKKCIPTYLLLNKYNSNELTENIGEAKNTDFPINRYKLC
jgi:hypothetical protein